MTEVSFLVHLPDPFAVQSSRFMIYEPSGECVHLSANKLSDFPALLLTYELPALIDDLRRLGCKPPLHILEIGDALRLLSAHPKDEGGEKLWSVWTALKRHFKCKADADKFERLALSRANQPDQDELKRLIEAAGKALANLWGSLVPQLKQDGEYGRLTQVEWPLQSAFAYRQFRGIQIDDTGSSALLERITAEKYSSYRQVAEHLNRSPTDLNYWNIQQHLVGTELAHLKDIESGGQMQSAFELAMTTSPFAQAFVSLMKRGRDASIVRRALGGQGHLFPIFHVFGTVSGRILVSDPYLQQLRRAYRSLIAAEPNHRLIYLDYAQFEPGVLAGLSADTKLIAAYNEGDLYSGLANVLFGDSSNRQIAKQIFLAFSYGMTPDRIASMIAIGAAASERGAYATKIEGFFSVFPELARFRVSQQDKLLANGYVSSLFGNRRLRTNKDEHLSSKEKRWSLNHPIQSTASLIFKEALNGIISEFGVEAVVLPVHDAVLLQFPNDNDFDRRAQLASEIMVGHFAQRIPSVHAKIKVGDFTD